MRGDGPLQRCAGRLHGVDLVLAHVLVGARALVVEQLPVVLGQAGHHLVEGARHQDLAGLGEAHHALRDVDAVADDVGLAVDVLDQPDRAEVDADAHLQLRPGRLRPLQRLAQREAHEQRVLRVAEEGERRAVAGVEDDAVVGRDVRQRLGQQRVQPLLVEDLLGDRLLRVLDDVEKHDAADEGAVDAVCIAWRAVT